MSAPPSFTSFEVNGGDLGALRWEGGPDRPVIVAVHGITANAWHWDPVAHHLDGAATLLAVDLRGRGRSLDLPGPYGIRRHADDVAAVIRSVGAPLVVAGHSMGCYVALMLAERHPDLVADLVLVDGGTPLARDPDVDVDEQLEQSLGPAISRLTTTWPDRVSYRTMWAQHPAYAEGIGVDLERNLLADLVEVPGGFRPAVSEAAVRADGRELLADDDVRSLLDRRDRPTHIVRAPAGIMGAPPPLVSDEMVERYANHRWSTVQSTNHYTVLLGPLGAQAVADTLREVTASVGA